jgi:hypothetical protein
MTMEKSMNVCVLVGRDDPISGQHIPRLTASASERGIRVKEAAIGDA